MATNRKAEKNDVSSDQHEGHNDCGPPVCVNSVTFHRSRLVVAST
jgi:hypothetical protein